MIVTQNINISTLDKRPGGCKIQYYSGDSMIAGAILALFAGRRAAASGTAF